MEALTGIRSWAFALLAIAVGAVAGAILRYLLSVGLNKMFPVIPPGTLVANLIAAFIVGLALAFFSAHASISPFWKFLIVTGFAGSLSTFSTFSAEIFTLLQNTRYVMASLSIGLHLFGSILMVCLGMFVFNLFKH